MKFTKTLLVLGCAAVLSGCGAKATYAKYKAAIGKLKDNEYTKCVVKVEKEKFEGTLKSVEAFGVKVSAWEPNNISDNENLIEGFVVANMMLTKDTAKAMPDEEPKAEDGEKITYYVNNLGYKAVDKDGNVEKIEWNKYGLVTSFSYDNKSDDSKDFKCSISYSK